ncbi:MAG: tRNA guanosine(15) transglycosylase TgtA [archaeon]|nr:tRNA guanosine(15) transglycosylase TgtA [archaeon]
MNFEVKKFDSGGRLGILKHNDKKMLTPNIFPVVSPFENLIPPQDIINIFGGSAVFTNAYILYNNKEQAKIALEKGIHEYINFNGLIATDSGAFQHYMYGGSDDITAENIEIFQEKIGADFPVILDLPVQLNDTREIAQNKVYETIKRAKENTVRRTTDKCSWFGPIHGGKYLDLEKHSSIEMNKLDFGIYAIGGVVKTFIDYQFDISVNIMLTVRRFLRPDRPLHLFGAGLPQFMALSVACGADLMDSAAYILFAKEGRYMTVEGTKNIEELNELPCNCPICSEYSANEIIKSYKTVKKEGKRRKINNKGIELIARHNLYVTFGELKTIRESIRNGTLWNLVEQRIQAHPKLIKAYRQIPKYWPQLELLTPMEKSKATFILGNISNSRPIIYRVIKKIFNISPFSEKKNIILLPELDCSVINSPTMRGWVKYIESLNNLSEKNEGKSCYEIVIISNIFGPIPYRLINIYPFVQRDWIYEYFRTNNELYSLLKYQNLNPSEFMRINQKTIDDSINYFEKLFRNNKINGENNLELGEFSLNPDEIVSHSDLINRIEICMNFFEKNKEKISKIIIVRPDSFLSEDDSVSILKTHLIDDLIQIFNNNNKEFFNEDNISIISSLENLD